MADDTSKTCPQCSGPHRFGEDDCPAHHFHTWHDRDIYIYHAGSYLPVPNYAVRYCTESNCGRTAIVYPMRGTFKQVHPVRTLLEEAPNMMPAAARHYYQEAADICLRSPGCAMLLLRLALVEWCEHKHWDGARDDLDRTLRARFDAIPLCRQLTDYTDGIYAQYPGLYAAQWATPDAVAHFASVLCELVRSEP